MDIDVDKDMDADRFRYRYIYIHTQHLSHVYIQVWQTEASSAWVRLQQAKV